MSAQIRQERNDYYDVLERTQKGTLDITPWLEWFLGCLGRAFVGTETTLGAVMSKARFWDRRAARLTINDRHRLVLNRLLDDFTGKLTTKKWAVLAKCSHDTTLRDTRSATSSDAILMQFRAKPAEARRAVTRIVVDARGGRRLAERVGFVPRAPSRSASSSGMTTSILFRSSRQRAGWSCLKRSRLHHPTLRVFGALPLVLWRDPLDDARLRG